MSSSFQSILPLFTRNSPFSSKLAFYLPYGYTVKAEFLRNKLNMISWEDLKDFSADNRTEIVLRFIGESGIDKGQITSYHSSLDLKDRSLEIGSNYSINLRKSLIKEKNRAQKMGVSLEVETNTIAISQFYNLYIQQNLHYHKSLFHPLILFNQFVNVGLAKIYTARRNGFMLGGIFVLFDSSTAYYAWGARDTNESLSIHTLLLDMLIKDSIKLGLSEVDFGLTPVNDKNLLQYKEKWGTNTNKVLSYSTFDTNRVIDLNNDFKFVRNIYSHIPLPVARMITPTILRAVIC